MFKREQKCDLHICVWTMLQLCCYGLTEIAHNLSHGIPSLSFKLTLEVGFNAGSDPL